MTRLDPIAATNDIAQTYQRYLRSVIRTNDPAIDAATARSWDALPNRTPLVVGPILESSPPFKDGRSIRQMVAEGTLSQHWLQGQLAHDLPLDRPLYLHQDRAISHATGRNRNLIVATGTGSGKTEAFLIPIIDALFRELDEGRLTPGVRALILYPMNALANDQLKRLRSLLASCLELTFGRYTGETKDRPHDALEERRSRGLPDPGPNEFISREQMQATPPHILLTNYAMLEYLLMRPDDSPLFEHDGQGWRFLVLDEVHSYDGAQALEIGMLLRRLLDRTGCTPGDVRCIGTSATLGSGAASFPKVAAFAQALFSAPFEYDPGSPERQDVLAAERRPLALPPAVEGRTLDDVQGIADAEERAKLLVTIPGAQQVLDAVAAQPCDARELAAEVFAHDPRASERLTELVDALATHRLPGEDHPILSARYHTFVRAIDGPRICLRSHPPDGGPFVSLHAERHCPQCGDEQALMAELATCRRCNQWYLRGELDQQAGYSRNEAAPDDSQASIKYLAPSPAGPEVEDEEPAEQEGLTPEAGSSATATDTMDLTLCVHCWKAGPDQVPCGCPSEAKRRFRVAGRTGSGSVKCVNCGVSAATSGPRRLRLGSDAPPAVLASTLYDGLPRDGGGARGKFISFADSRQDAAFFALYLERTYGAIARRRLILSTLRKNWTAAGGAVRIDDVASDLRKLAEDAGFFSDRDSALGRRRRVEGWLIAELTAMDRRQSLEGAGLAVRNLVRPGGAQPPPAFLSFPWNLTADEAWTVIETLLSSLLDSQIVSFPDGVDPADPLFAPRNRPYFLSSIHANPQAGIASWLPSSAAADNRRLNYLVRLLERRNGGESRALVPAARAAMEGLWDLLTKPGGSLFGLICSSNDSTGGGVRYQLDPDYWEWAPPPNLVRCTHCGLVAGRAVAGVCPTMRCHGAMTPYSPAGDDHFRELYQRDGAGKMTVEEHTAQWSPAQASTVQERFITGDVDVLSCSTTFELGVDVGDLQTVFLRNIPPATANYVQRAGRAGRRTDSVAFVLSYAQLRPHDQHIFTVAKELVAGRVPVPRVPEANARIVRRHVHSVAFSRYFRTVLDPGSKAWRTVGGYFIDRSGLAHDGFKEWLSEYPGELLAELVRIVPGDVQQELGIGDWSWASELLCDDSPLARAELDVAEDEATFQKLMEEAAAAQQFARAGYYQGVLGTLRGRYLLGFLATKNILPKYGFPVDVAELRTTHLNAVEATQLDLNRDLRLALSEFAPGSGVVAAKKLWLSNGFRLLPNRNLPVREYSRCDNCRRFFLDCKDVVCRECGHRLTKELPMVEPVFGFVAQEPSRSLGDERPARMFASEVLFARHAEDQPELRRPLVVKGGQAVLEGKFAKNGWLAVVNNGKRRGFQFCSRCGFARLAPPQKQGPRTHRHPERNSSCNGPLERVHLGHQFATDIVEFTLPLFQPQGQTPEQRSGEREGVLAALAEGAARKLDIRRDDLDTTYYIEHGGAIFVLYDAVPGGAGLAREVFNYHAEVVQAAFALSAGCTGCGEDSSCYACLRNYRNQPHHEHLNRSLVAKALEWAGP